MLTSFGTHTNTNTAFYGRVSSEEQAGNASTRGQQAEAEEYCARQGLNLRYSYFDEGKSGKSTAQRDQLQRMLSDARAGRFTHLVVWKLTRLSRNLIDTLKIIDELDGLGVQFHSITEADYDTSTSSGRMILRMMATVAEFEREESIENIRMGMKQRAQEGAWVGAEMLGYRLPDVATDPQDVVKDGRLIVVPEEAAVVRMIFDGYASGLGYRAIVNQLNGAGYRTKRNGPFNYQHVRAILDNPVYTGQVRFHTHDKHARVQQGIVVENAHAAIISPERWTLVRAMRAAKRTQPRRVSDQGYALTGLLRCPECGSRMAISRSTRKRKDGSKWIKNYYVCGRWRAQGTTACHGNGISADDAEVTVQRRLQHVVTHQKFLRDVVKRVNAQQHNAVRPLEQRLQTLTKERQQVITLQAKYYRAFEHDALTPGELRTKLDEIKAKLAELETNEAELQTSIATSAVTEPISYEAVQAVLDNFVAQLGDANPDRRRALLRALIQEATFEKGRGITSLRLHLHDGVARLLDLPTVTRLPSLIFVAE